MIIEAYLQGYMDKEAFDWDDAEKFYNNNTASVNALAGGIGAGALAKLLGASNAASGLYGVGGGILAGGGTVGYKNKDAIYAYFKDLFSSDKAKEKTKVSEPKAKEKTKVSEPKAKEKTKVSEPKAKEKTKVSEYVAEKMNNSSSNASGQKSSKSIPTKKINKGLPNQEHKKKTNDSLLNSNVSDSDNSDNYNDYNDYNDYNSFSNRRIRKNFGYRSIF